MTVKLKSARLTDIVIENFKNVSYGNIAFENSRTAQFSANILGLYGQNGSGKTVLIEALDLLKRVWTGESVPDVFADCIKAGADFAKVGYKFSFALPEADGEYFVSYSFCIKKQKKDAEFTGRVAESSSPKTGISSYRAVIFNEQLSYSFAGSKTKTAKKTVFNTATEDIFIPEAQYKKLIGSDKDARTDLIVAKKLAAANSQSFLFSADFIKILQTHCKEAEVLQLMDTIGSFARFDFYVIPTTNSGIISLNALPLTFMLHEENYNLGGTMLFGAFGTAVISEKQYSVLERILGALNIVLPQLVPGLTISADILEKGYNASGELAYTIQLMAEKGGVKLPLVLESEGTKKIVSVLSLLTAVYNNPAAVVVIDELDSGVFEYLLGELLSILALHAKGQLIFTSHNLRPLETIDKGFIAFTTTNPSNRYIRPIGVMKNNNLRNFYYRDIVLGEQPEETYQRTNNYDIAFAFKKAGKAYGA